MMAMFNTRQMTLEEIRATIPRQMNIEIHKASLYDDPFSIKIAFRKTYSVNMETKQIIQELNADEITHDSIQEVCRVLNDMANIEMRLSRLEKQIEEDLINNKSSLLSKNYKYIIAPNEEIGKYWLEKFKMNKKYHNQVIDNILKAERASYQTGNCIFLNNEKHFNIEGPRPTESDLIKFETILYYVKSRQKKIELNNYKEIECDHHRNIESMEKLSRLEQEQEETRKKIESFKEETIKSRVIGNPWAYSMPELQPRDIYPEPIMVDDRARSVFDQSNIHDDMMDAISGVSAYSQNITNVSNHISAQQEEMDRRTATAIQRAASDVLSGIQEENYQHISDRQRSVSDIHLGIDRAREGTDEINLNGPDPLHFEMIETQIVSASDLPYESGQVLRYEESNEQNDIVERWVESDHSIPNRENEESEPFNSYWETQGS